METRKGTFTKVEKSNNKLYGPRKIVIGGFPVTEQKVFLMILERLGLEDLSVVFPTADQLDAALTEVMDSPDRYGFEKVSAMPRAVILSGVSEQELHQIMGAYRTLGLPSPLWATLTPTSETWPLKMLLKELIAERRSFQQQDK